MNSLQRRQYKRKTEHFIVLRNETERYYQFDLKIEKAKKFCKRKCKGFWMHESDWNQVTFRFQKESDAVYFGLMWL